MCAGINRHEAEEEEALRGRSSDPLGLESCAEGLSPELQRALEPLLSAIEEVSERIGEYNDRIEALAQTSYPQVELLKQIKGVGTLIALTFLLTLEDPHRFRKSRDVGCYVGVALIAQFFLRTNIGVTFLLGDRIIALPIRWFVPLLLISVAGAFSTVALVNMIWNLTHASISR